MHNIKNHNRLNHNHKFMATVSWWPLFRGNGGEQRKKIKLVITLLKFVHFDFRWANGGHLEQKTVNKMGINKPKQTIQFISLYNLHFLRPFFPQFICIHPPFFRITYTHLPTHTHTSKEPQSLSSKKKTDWTIRWTTTIKKFVHFRSLARKIKKKRTEQIWPMFDHQTTREHRNASNGQINHNFFLSSRLSSICSLLSLEDKFFSPMIKSEEKFHSNCRCFSFSIYFHPLCPVL